ncbi:hypothetical protein [Pseudodesulfovibrio portus]|uniref:Uncharacterized protein n=1 Tax=Pseudodesulfovibrio portus TaxID=231439 RepID=A0ABM8AQ64_9BACT|nr:hypothetical protein [Pseudodesulfovibrio portus]BDQ33551.1 hypothetical protein JCM14722_10930 [Pseudodesulfovibrio portus]
MTGIRNRLQHRLNPLHLYCRLRTLGMTHGTAVILSRCYERALYRLVLA